MSERAAPPPDVPMREGQRVRVRLAGDPAWYSGTVLDRPRKQWVRLDNYAGDPGFIADENNIVAWEPLT